MKSSPTGVAIAPAIPRYRVLVAVRDEDDLLPLFRLGRALALGHEGEMRVITVTAGREQLDWFEPPDASDESDVAFVTRVGTNVGAAILDEVHEYEPQVLILGWNGEFSHGRYIWGRTLDPVIQKAPCEVLVLRGELGEAVERVLVPMAGGPNAPQAFAIARALAPEADITALYVASEQLGEAGVLLGRERLDALVRGLPDSIDVRTRVIQAAAPVEGILREAARKHDLLILGAGNENVVGRFLFGDIPQAVLKDAAVPVIILRRRLSGFDSLARRIWVGLFGLLPTLTVQEQAKVYKGMRRGARPSTDFFTMIALAAIIASLGLLLDSPAVIIGAMLVAPLMTAILGMGLSLVMGDTRFFWRSLGTTVRGMLLAMAMGFLVSLIVPGDALTDEVLGRANPSLLDLGVALASGAAAAYAISREDVSAALAGVAIAAALAPPLAVIGIGLQMRAWWIAGGALLLFLTNMVSIVAAGGLTFFLLGFRPDPGVPGRTQVLQRGMRGVAALLIAVTVPLAVLTAQSVQRVSLNEAIEAALQYEVRDMPRAELVSWSLDGEGEDGALRLDVTLRVPYTMAHVEARSLQERVAQRLDRAVALTLSMVPATQLQAYTPPTPTLTPSPTFTGVPSATPTPTPTATPTNTPTPTATATNTPIPTITPLPTATPTATPWVLYVGEVDRQGLAVHYAPNGVVMGYLPQDAAVIVSESLATAEDVAWYRVIAVEERLEGWVLGEGLETTLGE